MLYYKREELRVIALLVSVLLFVSKEAYPQI